MWHSLNLPPNYLFCDGSVYNTLIYARLFQVLGTNTTPNLTNRFVRGW